MRKRIALAAPVCVATLLLIAALPASANDTTLNVNVNPPRQLSDPAMPVRMDSEQITVHFGRERCRVAVEFQFENTSDSEVWLSAGFPDEDLLYRYAFYGQAASPAGAAADWLFPGLASLGDNPAAGIDDQSVLTDFKAWRRPAGSPVSASELLETRLLRIERIAWSPEVLSSLGGNWQPSADTGLNELMFCRVFDLHLQPGEKLVIGHSYSTLSGSNVESQALFNYTLSTGQTWQGSIGAAQIDVFLEDGLSFGDLNFENSEPGYGAACNPPREQWRELEPGHLRTVWRDFEPTGGQGFILLATKPLPPPSER
ncbi:hypothetical protein IT575_10180 [bacterium]|nr:hypothetical protein [bacterium]